MSSSSEMEDLGDSEGHEIDKEVEHEAEVGEQVEEEKSSENDSSGMELLEERGTEEEVGHKAEEVELVNKVEELNSSEDETSSCSSHSDGGGDFHVGKPVDSRHPSASAVPAKDVRLEMKKSYVKKDGTGSDPVVVRRHVWKKITAWEPARLPDDNGAVRGTIVSPALVVGDEYGTVTGLPMTNCKIRVFIANPLTAKISVRYTFYNEYSWYTSGQFRMPLQDGFVQRANVLFSDQSSRIISSVFLARGWDSKAKDKKRKPRSSHESVAMERLTKNRPGIVRFPVQNIRPSEYVTVSIDYTQSLRYYCGRCRLKIPLKMNPAALIGSNRREDENDAVFEFDNYSDRFNIVVTVGGSRGISSPTHNLYPLDLPNLDSVRGKTTAWWADPKENYDFVLDVEHACSSIRAAMRHQIPPEEMTGNDIFENMVLEQGSFVPKFKNTGGSWVLTVNPPIDVHGIMKELGVFPRDIIFLLDRSASMDGKPFYMMVNALEKALNALHSRDRYLCVVYDNEMAMPSNQFKGLSEMTMDKLGDWFAENRPRGGQMTLSTALIWSLKRLKLESKKTSARGLLRVPTLILITGGSIEGEEDLCKECAEYFESDFVKGGLDSMGVRMHALSVGPYANHRFLRMLTTKGRGYSGSLSTPTTRGFTTEMRHLMKHASPPILIDIMIDLDHARPSEHTSVYPSRIHDLNSGQPLNICGEYTKGAKEMPEAVVLEGTKSNGDLYRIRIPVRQCPPGLQLRECFLHTKIRQLEAEEWLDPDDGRKTRILSFSCREKVPSIFTEMVMYAVDRSLVRQLRAGGMAGYSFEGSSGDVNSKAKKLLLEQGPGARTEFKTKHMAEVEKQALLIEMEDRSSARLGKVVALAGACYAFESNFDASSANLQVLSAAAAPAGAYPVGMVNRFNGDTMATLGAKLLPLASPNILITFSSAGGDCCLDIYADCSDILMDHICVCECCKDCMKFCSDKLDSVSNWFQKLSDKVSAVCKCLF